MARALVKHCLFPKLERNESGYEWRSGKTVPPISILSGLAVFSQSDARQFVIDGAARQRSTGSIIGFVLTMPQSTVNAVHQASQLNRPSRWT